MRQVTSDRLSRGTASSAADARQFSCRADGRRAPSEEHAPKAAAPHTTCQRSDFRVVVDVGHTEAVPGAMSARGVTEYTFNLNLAQDVKQALVNAGFDKTVLLITSKAPFLGLFERAIRANAMRGQSFHFDPPRFRAGQFAADLAVRRAGSPLQRQLSGLRAFYFKSERRPGRQSAVR